MRVLIVDDQLIFRQHLRQMLARGGFTVVAEAGDIAAAVNAARSQQPDLAVVDVMLPGENGIVGTQRLRAAAPQMRIIVVSAYLDQADSLHEAALAAGADAFHSKEQLTPTLIETWKQLPEI